MRGARSREGMRASRTVESRTAGDVFLAYRDPVLCLALRPGPVVVLDNRSTHKVEGFRQRREAAGAPLLYRPPDAPDFNPSEKAGSKIKEPLRAAKSRTVAAWEEILPQALPTITRQNASAWFRHCGYGLH